MSAFLALMASTPPRITMEIVAKEIAAKHGLTLADLRSPRRFKYLNLPRQEAMAACYAIGRSNLQVAKFFHRTDHTTCIHARRAYAGRVSEAQP